MNMMLFILQNSFLGVGLAADAFTVSLANGLSEPSMPKERMALIAGVFAAFQAWMPMMGWALVRTVAQWFTSFSRIIPWIALCLLVLIGGKMLADGTGKTQTEADCHSISGNALVLQGVATSIDALSVGFTIAAYPFRMALLASLIIASVTFMICYAGVAIGRQFGTRLAGKAQVIGGAILIVIGLEVFFRGVLL